ncbi:MAG TPA: D-aminoacyl-tRNA deacylase [Candidatus Limnocylindrales bacterium]|nr:D-aminoacyl-tRNA deacylase [Candidatus Limnocylindrales bacterium]
MRVLLQRVERADVRVDRKLVGAIGLGLVAFVGVGREDTEAEVDQLASKAVELRIFRDEDGKTNLSLVDVGGEMLAISQFTLYADTRKGRRPSFIYAGEPALAERLYERFAATVEGRGVTVARGVFGSEMKVELINDGPMTIWLDSAAK